MATARPETGFLQSICLFFVFCCCFQSFGGWIEAPGIAYAHCTSTSKIYAVYQFNPYICNGRRVVPIGAPVCSPQGHLARSNRHLPALGAGGGGVARTPLLAVRRVLNFLSTRSLCPWLYIRRMRLPLEPWQAWTAS